ncbi:MAG TPA: monofunctional biosynthetic peptidoglycan transglycosylase [Woeseiaceae bacterium]|nr:monofunctional biosynthetic peptidoglycan transglycosylase [Woeseiaceae bacterium]
MPYRPKKRGSLARLLRVAAILAAAFALLSILLVLPLRWIDPPTTSFMLQDDSGRVPVAYRWTDWPSLGEAAALAVVAAEDQKFAQHFGFDLESIQASVMQYREGSSLRGASTITQQVAKNLYLWSGRSFVRKGIEAWLALLIEATWPKRRILEVYLNIVELGPGLYGVPAASEQYFGKEPARLSDAEAALLAAVLPNPRRLHAGRPSPYVRGRQEWIYRNMQRLRRQGWMTLIR